MIERVGLKCSFYLHLTHTLLNYQFCSPIFWYYDISFYDSFVYLISNIFYLFYFRIKNGIVLIGSNILFTSNLIERLYY